MSAVQALGLVVAVAVLLLLVVLTVLLARADRVLSEARALLAELAVRTPAARVEPLPTVPEAVLPEAVVPEAVVPEVALASVGAPGMELAVPEPAGGPTLREIATATLGPPLIRAAALGYGVRDVLADRADPAHRRRVRGRRPRARSSR